MSQENLETLEVVAHPLALEVEEEFPLVVEAALEHLQAEEAVLELLGAEVVEEPLLVVMAVVGFLPVLVVEVEQQLDRKQHELQH